MLACVVTCDMRARSSLFVGEQCYGILSALYRMWGDGFLIPVPEPDSAPASDEDAEHPDAE